MKGLVGLGVEVLRHVLFNKEFLIVDLKGPSIRQPTHDVLVVILLGIR